MAKAGTAMMIRNLLERQALTYKEVEFQPGSYLFQTGEELHKLYYLKRGSICLLHEAPEVTMRYVRSPGMVSIADLLRNRHVLSALVMQQSEVVEIDREEFMELLLHSLPLNNHYLQLICVNMLEEGVTFE